MASSASPKDAPPVRRGFPWGGLATSGFFLGSAALFVGERVLDGRAQELTSQTGFGLIVATTALRAALGLVGPRARRRENRAFTAAHLVALAAVGLYALSTDAGLARLGYVTPLDEVGKRLRGVLQCLFPIAWLAAAFPIALMERASPPRGVDRPPEDQRLAEAGLGGLSLAFAAALLVTVNFLASKHDVSWDSSWFRTARPGPGTQDLVRRLAEPVEAILFFPEANEVAEQVRGYFEELARANPTRLSVRSEDRLLATELAKQHRVRADGVVVLAQGEPTAAASAPGSGETPAEPEPATGPAGKQWTVGTELDNARHNLRKLDKEVYTRLVELARAKRVAYLTQGHGELNDRPFDAESRATWIRTILRRLQYDVKNLGLADGLGNQVPSDASVVITLAPDDPFTPEEVESLVRYADQGGRLLVALEPGQQPNLGRLLDALGLRQLDGTLTTENPSQYLVRRANASDRQNLVTASYSSHASVQNLSRGGRRGLVFLGASALDRASGTGGAIIDFPVRSMAGTWLDLDGDFEHAADREEKRVYQMVAASERKAAAASATDGEPTGMRAIVIGDGDFLSDLVLERSIGNGIFLGDALEWLAGTQGAATEVESGEDVPVEHTRAEDGYWFYGTVFGAPLVVLVLGLGYVRLRRRRRA